MTEEDFAVIRSARMQLHDPAGVNEILYVDTLPFNPDSGAAYYLSGDGKYHKYNPRKNTWEILSLKLSDTYIDEVVKKYGETRGIIALIDYLVAGLSTGLVSISAGAESVHLPTLADLLNFYRYLKQQKQDELDKETGANTGRTLRTRRRPVGGVVEWW